MGEKIKENINMFEKIVKSKRSLIYPIVFSVRAEKHSELKVSKKQRREIISMLTLQSYLFFNKNTVNAGILEGISEKEYSDDTSELIKLAKEISGNEKKNDDRQTKVTELKTSINKWVAKYRREPKFAGRPSYSNMYSAVNALSGHFNNFGSETSIPKKRLERILQELDQSSQFLGKGR